jgi:head-tail adaptor
MVDKLLQGNDLTYMQAETRKAMPDTVMIQRKSLAGDGQGGYVESWANSYQDVPARLSFTGGAESISAGRQDVQPISVLTVGYDQSVEPTDRVLHSSGTYEIQSVDTGKSWSAVRRCQMRRL